MIVICEGRDRPCDSHVRGGDDCHMRVQLWNIHVLQPRRSQLVVHVCVLMDIPCLLSILVRMGGFLRR